MQTCVILFPQQRQKTQPSAQSHSRASRGALRLAIGLVASLSVCGPALSQKPGGILRLPALDSPASMSILEESTIAVLGPMMGVPSDHLLFPRRNLLEP